nr:immunoglobulin heavy chain junction region [Macaca mulatta]
CVRDSRTYFDFW